MGGWRSMPILTNKVADALTCGVLGGRLKSGVLYTSSDGADATRPTMEFVLRRWAHEMLGLLVVGGPASIPYSTIAPVRRASGDITPM